MAVPCVLPKAVPCALCVLPAAAAQSFEFVLLFVFMLAFGCIEKSFNCNWVYYKRVLLWCPCVSSSRPKQQFGFLCRLFGHNLTISLAFKQSCPWLKYSRCVTSWAKQ